MVALLIIIYLAFIGLGLPDGLLGAGWPMMHVDIGAHQSAAGIITIIICGGTIVSSLLSTRLIYRFKTARVTAFSTLLTALALFGISFAPSFLWVCLLAIPLGLGAGAVDAALNNFVALHFKAKHMSWLHCFWGLGATVGPVIMSIFLVAKEGWRHGYFSVSIMQFVLVIILFASIPIWKKFENDRKEEKGEAKAQTYISNKQAFGIKGVKYAVCAMLFYCGNEAAIGLWSASYLVEQKGILAATAAAWVSFYYGGITAGRLLSGFIAIKMRPTLLIRCGCIVALMGVSILLLPLPPIFSLIGIILIGFGGAPFYPMTIHETPKRFGENASQAVIGLQMACAYIGSTSIPPLIGIISKWNSLSTLPLASLVLIIGMFFFSEKIARACHSRVS